MRNRTEVTRGAEINHYGQPCYLLAEVTRERGRFSVTGSIYNSRRAFELGADEAIIASGQVVDEIRAAFPELRPIQDLHLCDVLNGEPMHATANARHYLENHNVRAASRSLNRTMTDLGRAGVVTMTTDDDAAMLAEYIERLRPEWREAALAANQWIDANLGGPLPGNFNGDEEDYYVDLEESEYEARFSPEAWIGDYAIPVDPEGGTTWDCTSAVQELSRHYFNADDARSLAGWLDRDDVLKHDPSAPEWVREWSGPFTIRVHTLVDDDDSLRIHARLSGENQCDVGIYYEYVVRVCDDDYIYNTTYGGSVTDYNEGRICAREAAFGVLRELCDFADYDSAEEYARELGMEDEMGDPEAWHRCHAAAVELSDHLDHHGDLVGR